MSQGSFNPKIRFLCQKMWHVARAHTDRHTDRHTNRHTDTRKVWLLWAPFQGFRIFLSTYHQVSANMFSFPCPKDHSPKIRFLCQKVCSPRTKQRERTWKQKTNGFQEFFLQPIIKDRSNYLAFKRNCCHRVEKNADYVPWFDHMCVWYRSVTTWLMTRILISTVPVSMWTKSNIGTYCYVMNICALHRP